MLSDAITKMDFTILNWIQDHLKCEFLDKFLPAVTFLGDHGWFFIALAVLFVCIPKTRKWGAYLGSSLALGYLFGNLIIKNAVARTRPYDLVEHITLLVDKLSDFSFPSGHTLASFEFFTVICFLPIKKVYKVLAGVLAFTIAFSRLYLYVHFPSDVLAGIVLGTIFGIMGIRIVNLVCEEKDAGKSEKIENDK